MAAVSREQLQQRQAQFDELVAQRIFKGGEGDEDVKRTHMLTEEQHDKV